MKHIQSKPIHGSQIIKQDILTLQLKVNYELQSLILSFGEHMTVLEPLSLATDMKKRMQDALELYS